MEQLAELGKAYLTEVTATVVRGYVALSTAALRRSLPDILVCPISSQPRYFRRPGLGDCPLSDWAAVGLRHPSTVRVSKLLSVDKRIVVRVLGRLPDAAMSRIDSRLRSMHESRDRTRAARREAA
jgi:mRNA-degrading endonuclease toxin of MazEF toxin-antitoxin module